MQAETWLTVIETTRFLPKVQASKLASSPAPLFDHNNAPNQHLQIQVNNITTLDI